MHAGRLAEAESQLRDALATRPPRGSTSWRPSSFAADMAACSPQVATLAIGDALLAESSSERSDLLLQRSLRPSFRHAAGDVARELSLWIY